LVYFRSAYVICSTCSSRRREEMNNIMQHQNYIFSLSFCLLAYPPIRCSDR
jgi:hypothetical protein